MSGSAWNNSSNAGKRWPERPRRKSWKVRLKKINISVSKCEEKEKWLKDCKVYVTARQESVRGEKNKVECRNVCWYPSRRWKGSSLRRNTNPEKSLQAEGTMQPLPWRQDWHLGRNDPVNKDSVGYQRRDEVRANVFTPRLVLRNVECRRITLWRGSRSSGGCLGNGMIRTHTSGIDGLNGQGSGKRLIKNFLDGSSAGDSKSKSTSRDDKWVYINDSDSDEQLRR